MGEQEGFHFTEEGVGSNNRAGQQRRGVEQRAKNGGRAWRCRWQWERVGVACSSSRLPLDESLTCTQEAAHARALAFASCRCTTSANRKLSPRRANQS